MNIPEHGQSHWFMLVSDMCQVSYRDRKFLRKGLEKDKIMVAG